MDINTLEKFIRAVVRDETNRDGFTRHDVKRYRDELLPPEPEPEKPKDIPESGKCPNCNMPIVNVNGRFHCNCQVWKTE